MTDLGQILVETGRIGEQHLEKAKAHAAERGIGLEEAFYDLDMLTEQQVADALGRHHEIPGFSLARMPKPNPRVTVLVPEPIARKCRVVPLETAGKTLILLMEDPADIRTLQAVREQSKLEVQPVVGSPATVRVALDTFYPSEGRKLLEKALPFVAKLITEEAARTYRALPVDREGGVLTVAMAKPDSPKVVRALEMATDTKVQPVEARWEDIEKAIQRIWHGPARPAAKTEPAKPQPAEAEPAAPSPAKTEAATPEAAGTESLADILGTDAAEQPAEPAKPAAAAAEAGGGLSLDLDAPAGEAPSRPTPKGGSGAGLQLDLGSGQAPPPPAPPAQQARSSSGEDLSLDSLLEAADDAPKAVPASPDGDVARPAKDDGAIPLADLERQAAGAEPTETKPPEPARAEAAAEQEPEAEAEAEEPTVPPAEQPAPAEVGAAEGEEEDEHGPNLGAAGGPEGPKTGLKVDPTTRDQMKEVVAKTWGELDPRLAKLVPEKVARNYRVVVTGRTDKIIYVAMENPDDSFAVETVEFTSNLRAKTSKATPEQVEAGLEILYVPDEDEMADLFGDLEDVGLDDVIEREELEALSDLDAAAAAEAAPVVKLVNNIIANALKARASDIHLEVYEEQMRVRYRVDGLLQEIMKLPIELRDPMISRVKIMGRMDISERRLPQDGRLRMMKSKKPIDFRIATVPTIFGEKIVMRILDREQIQLDMTRLGFEPEPMEWFREAIHKPYGMVLVVGPSGCGKTNTLYSALADVNRPDVNIMTCEDPVEFSTTGLNQVQAQESIGLGFATALRSFLRQDPNVILVGEVRDFETAEIAIKAALTGHMVLSTLHTNDAPACINRLTNMGIEPFLIGSSLHLVVAQRLVRKVCESCAERDENVAVDQLVQMGFDPEEAKRIEPRKGTGCSECEQTGYRGRTALFEVLRVTDEMREMILYNGPPSEIRELAMRQGMRTLRQAGLLKIREGITTCDEVIRETIG